MKRVVAVYSSCFRSGKSTVADVLETVGYTRIKFAEPIKQMLWTLLPYITREDPYEFLEGNRRDDILPVLGVSGRYLMQTLGTEWMRDRISQNGWVDIVLNRIEQSQNVVIDDMRFANEYASLAQAAQECGWNLVFVRVVRPGFEIEVEHRSEGGLNDHPFDVIMQNDGTLEDLQRKARELVLPF